jgi:hypothetical protein
VTKQQFKEFYGAKVVSLLGPIFDRLFDVLGTHTHNPLALCMARPPACLACLSASTRTGSLRQSVRECPPHLQIRTVTARSTLRSS